MIAALFLSFSLEHFQAKIPWWIDAPSVIGFYAIFYAAFNKYLWRTRPFQRSGIVKTPDLRGVWSGTIDSSYDSYETQSAATLNIYQTWSGIRFTLETPLSKSFSINAMIVTENISAIEIYYEYRNEPRTEATNTMHIHYGTTRLSLSSDLRKLDGEYYTGRDRRNIGNLRFERYKK